jgi:hypothetical protein
VVESVPGTVVSVVAGGAVVVVVSAEVVEVDSPAPGVVVVGDGEGDGRAGSGKRSSRVTGGHIRAACAWGAGPATTIEAAARAKATTSAAPSLPCMVGRLTPVAGVGNPTIMRYVGRE